jgi:hypothetical protein
MLTADQLDALTDSISAIYEEYQQSVINDIARRLGKLKFDSAAWQMQLLTESGLTYQNALKELAKVTNKSEAELRRIFEKAGVTAMEFDDSVYKAAGLNPLPLNLSPAMAQVLAAGLAKTKNAMRNLTLTTALSAQQSFISAADLAYMQVASGAMSYDQAIRSAVKKLAADGVEVIHYKSGRRDQLDVAMRRTVLTGVSQTTGQMQTTRAAEMGADLVQVSAHAGARPAHQAWQGKIFSLSGKHAKYPDLAAATGYGTVGGLGGANCRHSFYIYFEGISENAYKAAELKSYANETVTYNGQKMSVYEATQVQRGIERDIRKWKREAEALQVIGDDNSEELAKVKKYQSRMRDFIAQMNSQGKPYKWHRQGIREQVDLAKAKAVESAPAVVKAVEKPKPPIYRPDQSLEKKLIEENSRIVAQDLNKTPEQVQAEFKDRFSALVTDNKSFLVKRARYDSSMQIAQDGRMKTQFETNTSDGALDKQLRAQAEYKGLGIPKDIDHELRPIYGYIKNKQIYKKDLEQNMDAIYGEIQFVIKKDNVFDRTTFTLRDSLGDFINEKGVGSLLSDPKVSASGRSYALKDFMSGGKVKDYIEFQTQNGVTLEDVDSVIIPKSREGNDPLGDLLRSKNIKVIYE